MNEEDVLIEIGRLYLETRRQAKLIRRLEATMRASQPQPQTKVVEDPPPQD